MLKRKIAAKLLAVGIVEVFAVVMTVDLMSYVGGMRGESADLPTRTVRRSDKQPCPHPKGWVPTLTQLQQSSLCNANLTTLTLKGQPFIGVDLRGADLSRADLAGMVLSRSDLSRANLKGANLSGADLREADLERVDLTTANLDRADFSKADLLAAHLSRTSMAGAKFVDANLAQADLTNVVIATGADFKDAKLGVAKLRGANLSAASIVAAKLNSAGLEGARLDDADLSRADLTNANLVGASLRNATVTDARLAYVNLSDAEYAPRSPPPDPYVVGIEGLRNVKFSTASEIGLVQLRELLQKAGLREREREITYAIEKGRTRLALFGPTNGDVLEGIFRVVAFQWPIEYGLQYGRALVLLFGLWIMMIPIYWFLIWEIPGQRKPFAGIYRNWPKDRVERDGSGGVIIEPEARVERLKAGDVPALAWAAWFSLLSTFHIGFREFSVGTWLSRVHPEQFTLEPAGWVRTVSGLQSLISLYLLAMWVLTYFGRPFQ